MAFKMIKLTLSSTPPFESTVRQLIKDLKLPRHFDMAGDPQKKRKNVVKIHWTSDFLPWPLLTLSGKSGHLFTVGKFH